MADDIAHAPTPKGKGGGSFWTKKTAFGLSGGMLLLVAGGAYIVYRFYYKGGSSGSAALNAAAKQAAATQAAQDSLYGTGGGSGGSTTTTGGGGAGYADDQAWQNAAVNYLVARGYDSVLANQAIGDYLGANPLSMQEHALVNLAIAAVGSPPVPPPPSGTPPSPIVTPTDKKVVPGKIIRVEYDIPKNGATEVAKKFGISVDHLQKENPGHDVNAGGVYNVPYQVKPNDTNETVARAFGISVEHLQKYL